MTIIFLYFIVIFLIIAAAVTHFILLILKTDRDADFSYHIVIIPAIVAYGIGTFILFIWSVLWFSVNGYDPKKEVQTFKLFRLQRFSAGFGFLAMSILTAGSLWTQILLARKFDLIQHITYLEALLPITIAFILSGLLFFIGLFVGYLMKTLYYSKKKKIRTRTTKLRYK